MIGALLGLGANLLLFFADTDRRLNSSGAAHGTVKDGIKTRKRKGRGQIKNLLTKEE
jgi:hypothetical protein